VSEGNSSESSSLNRHVAIALISAAVLILQVAVTRILSVIIWYHWAFFAISIAMLGVGAPGVWFALKPPAPGTVTRLLRFAAISLPLTVIAMIKGTMLFVDTGIVFCLLVLLPPVLSLGGAVCLLLLEAKGPAVAKIYAWDLLGACAGAVAVIPLMSTVKTPELIAVLSTLPLAASLLLEPNSLPRITPIGLGLLALLWWKEPFRVRASKNYLEIGATTPLHERWSPTARITVFAQPFGQQPTNPFGWGFGRIPPRDPAPPQYWLEQDGAAGTPITNLVGSPTKLTHLLYDVTSAGYQVRPPKQAAIIGGGGGRDILTALAAGTKAVDVVELNAATVGLLRGRLKEFSGGVYDLPGVRTFIGEGRSTVTRSDHLYDLLQISLIDSWAASAAGAYTLSEANLYTVEAYRTYLARLTPEGLVSTSRWMAGDLQLEVPRLLFVVEEALKQEGVPEPREHIVLVQGGAVGTVLLSKRPFTSAEKDRLRQLAALRGFDVHLPFSTLPPGHSQYATAFDVGRQKLAPAGFDLSPATDDKPFFFQMVSPFAQVDPAVARKYGMNTEGVVILRRLMLVTAAITLLLFFAPFALGKKVPKGPGFWRGSLFFTCIGLAFMLVEVSWVQRFILYLGHPSHALTVALASLLLGAGAGSMTASRIGVAGGQRFGMLVPVGLVAVNAVLAPLFSATLGWVLPLRIAVAALLLVPSGFLMGFSFPLGMLRFGDERKAWFWALNGAAGVLASVATLALFMVLGFTKVAYVGAGVYVLAWVLLLGQASPASDPAPEPAPAPT
jgi:spermidine synthase